MCIYGVCVYAAGMLCIYAYTMCMWGLDVHIRFVCMLRRYVVLMCIYGV